MAPVVRKFVLVLTALLLLFTVRADATARITEFMASNRTTVPDEDGDFPDWIELHHEGDAALDLGGFGLSDGYADPYRWVFPPVVLEPGAYLLIFASGKNRRVPGEELHTNFTLDSDGEVLLLTDPDGNRVDAITGWQLRRDIAAGREPGEGEALFFYDEPTPGAINDATPYEAILAPPALSKISGFYTDAFDLTMSAARDGMTIRYTLDGSAPTGDSPVYAGAIAIESRRGAPNTISEIRTGPAGDWSPWRGPSKETFKATVVRASAFRDGAITSTPATATYFVDDGIRHRYHVPVISLVADPEGLFSEDRGIYVPGVHYDGTNVLTGNYFQRGDQWERPAHVTLFDPNGVPSVAQDVGIRIHGGTTRRFSPKALRFYARPAYGNGTFEYPVFGGDEPEKFQRLLLRASGNGFSTTLFRDALMQSLVQSLGLEQQRYQPAVLFINGAYWGIHNIRDRLDEHYLQQRYGVDPDQVDLLTGNGDPVQGDSEHYEQVLRFVRENDLAVDEHYAHVKTLMDVENFSTYQAVQIYFANTDWPDKNIDYWRFRNDTYDPDAPPGMDGRWRWMLYDTDFGFGFGKGSAPEHNTLQHARSGAPDWSTELFRNLLENDDFKRDFINRQADYLNTIFRPETVLETIADFQANLEPLMREHIERWGYPDSVQRWRDEIEYKLNRFARERPAYLRQHLVEAFALAGTSDITLDVPVATRGGLRINGIAVGETGLESAYPWTGIYFQGIPVEIEAVPATGYTFSHWSGLPRDTPATTTVVPGETMRITAHFRRPGAGLFGGCHAASTKALSAVLKRYAGDLFLLGFSPLHAPADCSPVSKRKIHVP